MLPKFLIPELMLQTTDKKDAVGGKRVDHLAYEHKLRMQARIPAKWVELTCSMHAPYYAGVGAI